MADCAAWSPDRYCTTGPLHVWRPDQWKAPVYLCPHHHPDQAPVVEAEVVIDAGALVSALKATASTLDAHTPPVLIRDHEEA